jgi:hypothetical protein
MMPLSISRFSQPSRGRLFQFATQAENALAQVVLTEFMNLCNLPQRPMFGSVRKVFFERGKKRSTLPTLPFDFHLMKRCFQRRILPNALQMFRRRSRAPHLTFKSFVPIVTLNADVGGLPSTLPGNALPPFMQHEVVETGHKKGAKLSPFRHSTSHVAMFQQPSPKALGDVFCLMVIHAMLRAGRRKRRIPVNPAHLVHRDQAGRIPAASLADVRPLRRWKKSPLLRRIRDRWFHGRPDYREKLRWQHSLQGRLTPERKMLLAA